MYDPHSGRFASEDPVKGLATMPQTLNPYAYGANGPLAYPDPSGRFAPGLLVLAGAAAAVAAPAAVAGMTTCAVIEYDCTSAFAGLVDDTYDSITGREETLPSLAPEPEPEALPAPGSEVVPGASDSHMGAVDKIPPASAATAAATNGEDNIRDILKGARVVKGRFPRTANPGETLVRRDPNTGAPTHYQRYDADGLPIKRVDLTGRPHGGVPTPHVLEFVRNVNPKTGEVFVRPNRFVRAARPEEIP